MKEFLTRIRDKKFDISNLSDEFLKDLEKYRRYVSVELSSNQGSVKAQGKEPVVSNESKPINIRLSSRGYKVVGRRKLFQ